MTAEKFYQKWNLEHYYESNNHNDLINVMKDYAELKCKELLNIVAEKAKTKTDYFGGSFRGDIIIDKDSILNAVNLKEFIQ
jgi:hypothetical protein